MRFKLEIFSAQIKVVSLEGLSSIIGDKALNRPGFAGG
jgi:hypothetical protein